MENLNASKNHRVLALYVRLCVCIYFEISKIVNYIARYL